MLALGSFFLNLFLTSPLQFECPFLLWRSIALNLSRKEQRASSQCHALEFAVPLYIRIIKACFNVSVFFIAFVVAANKFRSDRTSTRCKHEAP